MSEIDFKTYEKIDRKLNEISDILGCVKDVTNKYETLLRIEREKIDELFEIIEELKGEKKL